MIDLSKGHYMKRPKNQVEDFSFTQPKKDDADRQEGVEDFVVSSMTSGMFRGDKKFAMPHVEDNLQNGVTYFTSNGVLEATEKMNEISDKALESLKYMGEYIPIIKSHFPDLKTVGPCKDQASGATYTGQ